MFWKWKFKIIYKMQLLNFGLLRLIRDTSPGTELYMIEKSSHES